jgi:hypothetical protein
MAQRLNVVEFVSVDTLAGETPAEPDADSA